MTDYYRPIMLVLACCVLSVWVNPAAAEDPNWTTLAEGDATEDRKSIIFDGRTPNKLACDTTLRRMPDGSWVMIMLGGGFAAMHWSVHAMFAVGLLMMAIFGHIRFGPYRRLMRAVAAREWPKAAPQLNTIRMLVALNLALGVGVFVVAVVGRAV